jgi:outer membrane receptor protein involved in Fe transport
MKLKDSNEYQIAGSLPINRYYRYLSEKMFDGKIDVEQPLANSKNLTRKIKFGINYIKQNRENKQYNYSMNFGQHADLNLYNNDLAAFFNPQLFDFSTGIFNGQNYISVDKFYEEDALYSNHTIGNSSLQSAYVMTDYNLSKKIKINAGVRYEHIKMHSDVARYDSLNYQVDDQRRFQTNDIFLVNPGELDTFNFYPALSVIYKLIDNDERPFNIRFNYSKTTARPSLREITETVVFDYELRDNVFGNSKLKPVYVHNFDFRMEKFFNQAYNISISAFYKNFKNHIELIQTGKGYTWENVEKSTLRGLEIEGKANLIDPLELRANITLCKSSTTFMRKRLYTIVELNHISLTALM